MKMNAQNLTPVQLADIVLQVPDRVTAGVLERCGVWERWRDEALTRDYDEGQAPARGGWRRRLLTHFDAAVKVAAEHPRSLRRACMELKALGFANAQIDEIRQMAYRFILMQCEPGYILHEQNKQDFPGRSHWWCDRAFLGAALLGPAVKSRPAKTIAEMEAQVHADEALKKNAAANRNSIVADARMAAVEGAFRDWVAEYVARPRPVSLLAPAAPRRHFAALVL